MEISYSSDIPDAQLISLAVEGDLEARQVLARRIRNLRSMDRKTDAQMLADQYFQSFSNSE